LSQISWGSIITTIDAPVRTVSPWSDALVRMIPEIGARITVSSRDTIEAVRAALARATSQRAASIASARAPARSRLRRSRVALGDGCARLLDLLLPGPGQEFSELSLGLGHARPVPGDRRRVFRILQAGDHLPCLDRIPLPDQKILNASQDLRSHPDLGRLNSPCPFQDLSRRVPGQAQGDEGAPENHKREGKNGDLSKRHGGYSKRSGAELSLAYDLLLFLPFLLAN